MTSSNSSDMVDISDIPELDFSLSSGLGSTIKSRVTYKNRLDQRPPILPNQKFSIEIPGINGLIDLQTAYLEIKVKFPNSVGSPALMHSISSIFDNFRVSSNTGESLEEIRDLGLLSMLFDRVSMPHSYRKNSMNSSGNYEIYDEKYSNPTALGPNIAGTIYWTLDSVNVTGVNTFFTSALKVGGILQNAAGAQSLIIAITDDTHLVLGVSYGAAVTQANAVNARTYGPTVDSDYKTFFQTDAYNSGASVILRLSSFSGFFGFNSKNYFFPLWVTQGLKLDFSLYPLNHILNRSTDAGDSFQIEDVHIHYEVLQPDDILKMSIDSVFKSEDKLALSYTGHQTLTSIISAGSSRLDYDVKLNLSNVKSIFVVLRESKNMTDRNLDSFVFTSNGFTDVGSSTFQATFNNIRMPSEPITTRCVLYSEFLKGLNIFGVSQIDLMSYPEFLNSSCVFMVDLERYQSSDEDDIYSGADLSSLPLKVQLKLDANVTADVEATIIVSYTQVVKISDHQSLEVLS